MTPLFSCMAWNYASTKSVLGMSQFARSAFGLTSMCVFVR
ncbi:hypothetical protein HMPREF9244_01253 [Alloscardovia omnicolens F0580]|uniref:Uncharacterized protein n=1 Tax=Alloscardovia omnicolens F0580 TaxID=1321816 RepID=U1SHN5_9BIFI|nr:hypothetical protein HMPREF9244_01253 [Alloscardovia omnicolens F0580]